MTGVTILGNWKMYGDVALLDAFAAMDLNAFSGGFARPGLAVPSILLSAAREKLAGKGWSIGAQDVSEHPQGAYTGATSAAMLKEAASDFCLVGHSERRAYQHESDAQVAAKIERLTEVGIEPVVCVGETLEERETGKTDERVTTQLRAVIKPLQAACASGLNPCVAYEPVWAIGTGKSATPAQAQEVHARMRELLGGEGLGGVRLLYGGSVKGETIAELTAQTDIDGALVGGAALTPEGWSAMLKAVA